MWSAAAHDALITMKRCISSNDSLFILFIRIVQECFFFSPFIIKTVFYSILAHFYFKNICIFDVILTIVQL